MRSRTTSKRSTKDRSTGHPTRCTERPKEPPKAHKRRKNLSYIHPRVEAPPHSIPASRSKNKILEPQSPLYPLEYPPISSSSTRYHRRMNRKLESLPGITTYKLAGIIPTIRCNRVVGSVSRGGDWALDPERSSALERVRGLGHAYVGRARGAGVCLEAAISGRRCGYIWTKEILN